ncbi:hypothetical protein ACFX12_029415 [Malus domestica]
MDFNLVPDHWGFDVRSWLEAFAAEYSLLEELRLKRMTASLGAKEMDADSIFSKLKFHGSFSKAYALCVNLELGQHGRRAGRVNRTVRTWYTRLMSHIQSVYVIQ